MSISLKTVLSAYDGQSKYLFDRQSGAVERSTEQRPFQGFGQWRTLGLLGDRKRTFVATFISEDDLVLWLAGHEYQLRAPGMSANVDRIGLLPARRFELRKNAVPLVEAKYWFFHSREWPDDGDIFSLVHRIVSSPEMGKGFVHAWKAAAEGRDLSSAEFLREVDSLARSEQRSRP